MRDPALLAATLCTIRRAGVATRATAEHSGQTWLAGLALLNGQAIQDLLEDGWLQRHREGDCLFIDAWPSFAGDDPGPGPSPDAQQTRSERVFS